MFRAWVSDALDDRMTHCYWSKTLSPSYLCMDFIPRYLLCMLDSEEQDRKNPVREDHVRAEPVREVVFGSFYNYINTLAVFPRRV